ncbi:MAG: hypothetical protein AMDU2_EPLC00006G0150 [Thermoplasmatales archaeon E-plasma]|nr:MAG: hypothetical protein AMDU2_EPLC00006G0150 [Thermoplasmatales archaeon E-plasma]
MSKNIYVLSEGKLSVDEDAFRFDSKGELTPFSPHMRPNL